MSALGGLVQVVVKLCETTTIENESDSSEKVTYTFVGKLGIDCMKPENKIGRLRENFGSFMMADWLL